MELKELLSKPVWQTIGEEFIPLNRHASTDSEVRTPQPVTGMDKKHVYGISGITRLFGYSMPTASHVRKSGRVSKAIMQIGRKIIVDVEPALELVGHKSGGRK